MNYTLRKNQEGTDCWLTFHLEGTEDVEKITTPLGYIGISILFDDIQRFIRTRNNSKTTTIVVKNDSGFPPLGVIVDVYHGEDEDPDTCTFWFDDYESLDDEFLK